MVGMAGKIFRLKYDQAERERRYEAALADVKRGASCRAAAEDHSVAGAIRIDYRVLARMARERRVYLHHLPFHKRILSVDRASVRNINDAALRSNHGEPPSVVASSFGINTRELTQWLTRRTAMTLAQQHVPVSHICERLHVDRRRVERWLDLHGISTTRRERMVCKAEDFIDRSGSLARVYIIWAFIRAGYTDDQIRFHRKRSDPKHHYNLKRIRGCRVSLEVRDAIADGCSYNEMRKRALAIYGVLRDYQIHVILKTYGFAEAMRLNDPEHLALWRNRYNEPIDDGYWGLGEMLDYNDRDPAYTFRIRKAVIEGRLPAYTIWHGKQKLLRVPKYLKWPLDPEQIATIKVPLPYPGPEERHEREPDADARLPDCEP